MRGEKRIPVFRNVVIDGYKEISHMNPSKGTESQDLQHTAGDESQTEEMLQRECEAIREEAARKGYQEGHDQAVVEVNRQLIEIKDAFDGLTSRVIGQAARLMAESERDVVELAVKIAEKLIQTELTVNPKAAADAVRALVERAAERRQVRVRVGDRFFSLLKETGALSANTIEGVEELELVNDPMIKGDGCVIETSGMIIDAEFEDMLERIREKLLEGGVVSEASREG